MADRYAGVATSPGVGAGPAQVVQRSRPQVPHRRVAPDQRPAERERFGEAVSSMLRELVSTEEQLRAGEDNEHSALALSLVGSHRAVLNDPLLIEGVRAEILDQGRCAEWALERVLDKLHQALDRLGNADLRDWWRDVEALAATLMRRLLGEHEGGAIRARAGVVLVAHELGVGEAIAAVRAGVAAIVLEEGSLTSHVAILCRSAGLPAVVAVEHACTRFEEDVVLRVDGDAGQVQVLGRQSPTPAGRRSFDSLAVTGEDLSTALKTADGVVVKLRANLDLRLDAAYARRHGTRGVGLLRTVYQYAGRSDMPTLEELTALYRSVLADFAPEPVSIRLLDLGGPIEDEALPPPLRGLSQHRGIRLWAHRPEVIDLQLEALCRAADAGRLRILVPFVTEALEIVRVRDRVRTLASAGGAPEPEIGAMIEVPAALMLIDEIADQCDFLAIGTNDLCQFLFAVPRDAPVHEGTTQPEPALLRAVALVTDAGRARGIDVCLCGELASRPEAVPLLLRAGLRELSVSPRLAPAVRPAVATCTVSAGGRVS